MIKKLEKLTPFAAVFIRIAFGFHLLYYSWEDVFGWNAGANAGFLQELGIPFPWLMSWVYILTEFIGGFALIVGFKTRLIAIPLIITFLVALFLVHTGDPYEDSFQAIQMLAVSCFFLFHGSGKLSLDNLMDDLK